MRDLRVSRICDVTIIEKTVMQVEIGMLDRFVNIDQMGIDKVGIGEVGS